MCQYIVIYYHKTYLSFRRIKAWAIPMPSLSFPSALWIIHRKNPSGTNGRINGKTVHQPFKLFRSNTSGFLWRFRPLKTPLRQPDVQKDEPVPGPQNSLEPITPGAAEQE